MSDDKAPARDTTIDGRYRLLERLDDYGLGECWRARDTRDNTRVTVKLLPAVPATDRKTAPEFQSLAKRLEKLQNRAVGATLAHGVWQGRPYLVTDHLAGVSLLRGISKARSAKHLLDRGTLANLLDLVCEAVAAAHASERPILHGGLTPASVVAAMIDDRLQVRVLDFGLAPLFGKRLPKDRSGEYIAPEVEDDPGRLSPAADVFALGAILLEAITDRSTVSGGPSATVGGLSAVAKLREDLPPALMGVASRATKLDPDARFPDVAALREALAVAWSPPDRPALEAPSEAAPPSPAPASDADDVGVAVHSWVRFADQQSAPAPFAPAPMQPLPPPPMVMPALPLPPPPSQAPAPARGSVPPLMAAPGRASLPPLAPAPPVARPSGAPPLGSTMMAESPFDSLAPPGASPAGAPVFGSTMMVASPLESRPPPAAPSGGAPVFGSTMMAESPLESRPPPADYARTSLGAPAGALPASPGVAATMVFDSSVAVRAGMPALSHPPADGAPKTQAARDAGSRMAPEVLLTLGMIAVFALGAAAAWVVHGLQH